MNAGSLFSGIGGLDLGVDLEPTWFCESDPACREVLERHWPGVPVFPDVRELDATVPAVEVLHGGYPCQPFSSAGKRLGERDERHLWPEFARLVRVLRPRHVVLENVAGHLVLGFDRVLADLAGMGLGVRWGVVRASDAGAPHRRSRLFAVASDPSRSERGEAEQQGLAATGRGAAEPRERFGVDPAWGVYGEAVVGWERVLGRSAPAPVDGEGGVRAEFVEWMMGFPRDWTEGHDRLTRLRMLGNSVVPQQAGLALSLLGCSWGRPRRQEGDPEWRRLKSSA